MSRRLHYYDSDYKYIPMTRTDYVKDGSKWKPIKSKKELISRNQSKLVLNNIGLPFEKSHRLEKRDKFGHNEKYDYFSSISPDGKNKSSWQIDFYTGHKNYIKNSKKYYYNKNYYIKHKKKK